jgi:hypothetical protein
MPERQSPKTVALAALGFALAFFATFYVLSGDVGDSLGGALLGGVIFLGAGVLLARKPPQR